MKMNGVSLVSRGNEIVYIYRERTRRTVYQHPDKWKFYVKMNGEFIEVYHKSCYFSTEPDRF